MKKYLIPILALLLSGCDNETCETKHVPYDFVMSSAAAMSNAQRFQAPPEEWSVMCDHNGHYTPAHEGFPYDTSVNVRTSRWEAVVAAWRTKEVLQALEAPANTITTNAYNWKECSE